MIGTARRWHLPSRSHAPLVAHLGLGRLYRRTDKREQAQGHLAIATTMYRDMGMTYWLEQAEADTTDLERTGLVWRDVSRARRVRSRR